jgi:hypothetical protein
VPDIDYFVGKAEQCFRLADACSDREVARRLRELGNEFLAEAVRRGADPDRLPPPVPLDPC